jgi:hypothetical protein
MVATIAIALFAARNYDCFFCYNKTKKKKATTTSCHLFCCNKTKKKKVMTIVAIVFFLTTDPKKEGDGCLLSSPS